MHMLALHLLAAIFLLVVLPAVVTPLLAHKKGFQWYYWLFAGSWLGLVIVGVLPAANAPRLLPEEQKRRRDKAFRAGTGVTALAVGIAAFRAGSPMVENLRSPPEEPARQEALGMFWQSRFHPVRVAYGPPWVLSRVACDSEDGLLAEFVDRSDGKSYTVLVATDVPETERSNEVAYDRLRRSTLALDPANKLIDETDCRFHGAVFHRFRFKVHDPDAGPVCCHWYVRGVGTERIAVGWSFPYDDQLVKSDRIPPALKAFDAQVELYEGPVDDSPGE